MLQRILRVIAFAVLATNRPTEGQSAGGGVVAAPANVVFDKAKFHKLQPAKYYSEDVYVRFVATTPIDVRNKLHRSVGANIEWESKIIPGLTHVKVPVGTEEKAINAYLDDPSVLYAEPQYERSPDGVPNDGNFSSLWGMQNTGQTVNGVAGTPGADIRATQAWDYWTGDPNFKIAIIDNGLNYSHWDLNGHFAGSSDSVWTNPGEIPGNGIDDDHNGYIDDVHGFDVYAHVGEVAPTNDACGYHGTHVAGTIGATGNNAYGVAGVNWRCKLVACKTSDTTSHCYVHNTAEALEYVLIVGCTVSNNSYGGGGYEQAEFDMIQAAQGYGHLFVASAGNDHSNVDLLPSYPATYNLPNIISVAATDNGDARAAFSNYGATTVDIAAPGVNIQSTIGPGNEVGFKNGTSMACPHVAGTAALLMSNHLPFSWQQIKRFIMSTARRVPSMQGRCVTGGVLNAGAAMQALYAAGYGDCNTNGTIDLTETQLNPALDCNGNGQIDACEFGPVDSSTLSFDGSAAYVDVGNAADLNRTTNFTVEAWVRVRAFLGGTQRIISNRAANGFGFGTTATGQLILTTFGVKDYVTTSPVLVPGAWKHVAAVFRSDNSVQFFGNGQLIQTVTGTSSGIGSASTMNIGRNPDGSGEYWSGEIDELRLWSTARAQVDIQRDMRRPLAGNEPSILGLWHFNEGSGTTAADAAGGNSNGLVFPTPVWIPLASDCNHNGVPDSCDPDCDHNGVPDACDLHTPISQTFTGNDAYQLNGSAVITSGGNPGDVVRLTPASPNQSGSVLFPATTRPVVNFTAAFDFRIDGGTSADGFSLAILDASTHGIGDIFGEQGPAAGSLAVEFDTYNNGPANGDPNNNHLSIRLNGAILATYTPTFALRNNAYNHVFVNFFEGRLYVVLTPSGGQPQTAFSAVLIPGFVPYRAYFGFGARTGGNYDQHFIDNVVLNIAFEHDCNANEVPDVCDGDCDTNGLADSCDIAAGRQVDCNHNGVPDACDVSAGGGIPDCNTNGVPDPCELDTDGDGRLDVCDNCVMIANPDQRDRNTNGIGDACEIAANPTLDCDHDGLLDSCRIAHFYSIDRTSAAVIGFQDISTTGTSLPPEDDQGADPSTTLPFTNIHFPTTTIKVSYNGVIGFTENPTWDSGAGFIPAGYLMSGSRAFAPYWTSLYPYPPPYGTGSVDVQTIGTAPNRVFACEWYMVFDDRYYFPSPVTFEVQLFETPTDGIIAQYLYQDIDFVGNGSGSPAVGTIGAQLNGSTGIMWSHNVDNAVANGTVLSIRAYDADGNGAIDSCEPCFACPGDLNGDRRRDGADVQAFLSCFGQSLGSAGYCRCADMDGDGHTDLVDLNAFVARLRDPSATQCP